MPRSTLDGGSHFRDHDVLLGSKLTLGAVQQFIMFDFKSEIANIGGWLTESEGRFLYESARRVCRENVIVEIGSWKGRSTVCLGRGAEDGNGATTYAIDAHIGSSEHQKMFGQVDTFEDFMSNIAHAKVDSFIQPIRDASEMAARHFAWPIEFIFIDGAHEFELVTLDFQLWFPKVISGGFLAFHDSWHFWGPNLATAVALLTSSKIRKPKLIDTITYFQKVDHNSLLDRIENISFLIFRTLLGIKGMLKLKYEERQKN